jgi:type II secretion system protein D
MKKIWVWAVAGLLTVAIAATWQVNAQSPVSSSQSFQLRNAQAGEIAPKLRAMLGERGRDVEVLVDQRSNRVLVRGAADEIRIANRMVEVLDRPAAIPQQHSTPVVKAYSVNTHLLERTADQLRAKFANEPTVRIATDNRTGQLLVVAPPELQSKIAPILNKTSPIGPRPVPQLDPGAQTSHRLTNITWQDFEGRIKNLWGEDIQLRVDASGQRTLIQAPRLSGEQIVMQVDRRTNTVFVHGPAGMSAYWLQVISGLDSIQSKDRASALLPLGRAEPAQIRQVVNILRNAALATTQGKTVSALGVATNATQGSELVSMIFRQNQNQPPAAGAANKTAEGDPPAANEEVEDSGLIGDVEIQFVPELGIIIVKGHRRDVEKVKKIIAQIGEASEGTRPDVEVRALTHVNSQALADLIKPIYEEIYLPRQGAMSITALGKPNALLLIGRTENITIVKDLIYKLDKPVAPQTLVKVFQLKHMTATTAAEEIQQLYSQENATTPPANDTVTLHTRVNVIADFRSNSLIVQAGPRDMDEIEDLLKKLDTLDTPTQIEVRIFPLRNALAETLQTTLSAAIAAETTATTGGQGGQGAQNTDGQRGSSVTFVRIDADGKQLQTDGGITAEVSITADANTNSLVVRAPSRTMPLIQALIEQLDNSPEAESLIKVFEVLHGDATNLTLMLQELFGLEVTAGSAGALRQTLGAFGGQAQVNQQTAGDSSLIPLRFTPEARSNSIVASGSAADLEIVEGLLIRLDEDNSRGRTTQVYRLNNAGAEAVATALTNILNSQLQLEQTQVNQQISTIGQREFLDGQVFVQPEINTNSLLVSATPELFDMISDVIADLDRRPPMVMIQVVIAEVTLGEREETGAEVGIQDSFLFDRGLATPVGYDFVPSNLPNATDAVALASRGVLGGQGFSALGLGRTSASAGFPGMVLSASNESISVLIRALESSTRMQVLSRPQIMTMHNVPASILVGQRVPRVTDINTNASTTTSSTTLDDIGLSLGVIPRVTPDGLIVMDLEVAKSSVGDPAAGIPIAPGVNSPIYADTTAITTLSARDGQTIVFSGLISKERTDAYRGVPFLSSIPILGRMFRFDQHAEERTELLIFLTPHIVYSGEEEQIDWINATESERMSWCLADLIELHGNVGLSHGRPGVWSPKECPVIFPDGDPNGGVLHESPNPVRREDLSRPFVSPEESIPARPFVDPNARENRPFIEPVRQSTRQDGEGDQPTPAVHDPSARFQQFRSVQPASHNRTVPSRQPNSDLRREFNGNYPRLIPSESSRPRSEYQPDGRNDPARPSGPQTGYDQTSQQPVRTNQPMVWR